MAVSTLKHEKGVYQGEVKNNLPNGKGKFIYDKGSIAWYIDFCYHGLSTSFINFAS